MSTPPVNRAAWAELLDIEAGQRVLLFSDEPEPVLLRLEPFDARVALASEQDPTFHDLVIVDRPSSMDRVMKAGRRVADGGRMAVVADNRWSPLRWFDRANGATVGPSATLGQIRSVLGGFSNVDVFGLLRGSDSSPTAFRVDLPDVADGVLRSATVNSPRLRRIAVNGLRSAAVRKWSAPLVPAWLLVASETPTAVSPATPTGRIGVELNAQGVVVLGAGPDAIEKFYRDPSLLSATVESLQVLHDVGFSWAPRIVAQPSSSRIQIEWIPGQDIDANRMTAGELEPWLHRAGQILGELQRRTLRPDQTVRVHGDLWLGAMVADGDEIVAIIDWDDSHWGDPRTDMTTLLAVAHDRPFSDADRRRLVAAAYAGHRSAGGPERARSVQTKGENQ